MTRTSIFAAAAGFFAASAISASALPMTVLSSDCEDPADAALIGIACGVSSDRMDPNAVNLGDADGDFFSLGLGTDGSGIGGGILLEIDPAFTGPAILFEVTSPSNHFEAADVYVSNELIGANSVFVGTVFNSLNGPSASNMVEIAGSWRYIGIVDVTAREFASTGSEDGFDLDAVKVSVVPVPAGVLLLGTALAGLGLSRRRG